MNCPKQAILAMQYIENQHHNPQTLTTDLARVIQNNGREVITFSPCIDRGNIVKKTIVISAALIPNAIHLPNPHIKPFSQAPQIQHFHRSCTEQNAQHETLSSAKTQPTACPGPY
jgi:hypothetical protein